MPSSIWILKDETEGSDPPHLFGKMMLLPSGTGLGLEEPKSRLCVCVFVHTCTRMHTCTDLKHWGRSSWSALLERALLAQWQDKQVYALGPLSDRFRNGEISPGTLPSRAMLEVNKWQGKGYKTQTEVLTSAELVITAHSPLPFSLY